MSQGQNDLSVAIQYNTESVQPGVLLLPGHPRGCTCGDEPDIQVILAGGMSLRTVLEMCENLATALREQTVADPETGELYPASA